MRSPLSAHLPPACRFLLETVCLGGDSIELRLPASTLCAEAIRQGIAGLLHEWARAHPDDPASSHVLAELSATIQTNALHALRVASDTIRVTHLLQGAGIQSIALKGPLLSLQYYSGLGIRDAGDVDVLVDERRALDADRILGAAGYARAKPRALLAGRRAKLYLDTQHEFGYRTPLEGGTVELHWRFADCRRLSPLSFDELWQRSQPVRCGRDTLQALGPVDTFMQLACHGGTDGWSRLKWVADLPRVLHTLNQAQLSEVRKLALSTQTGRVVDLALALIGQGDNPAVRAVAHHIGGERPKGATGLRAYWHRAAFLLGLCETPRQRLSALYANLITPEDFDALDLPDGMTPLLPYLAQGRRAARKLATAEG